MIGILPKSLFVDDKAYKINTDFRVVLLIFSAYNDEDLTDFEKMQICVKCLYKEVPHNVKEAYNQALWFLDGGKVDDSKQSKKAKIMDWEQDESIIFSSINKVAGFEVREKNYIHWWTFLGYFNEISEGYFSYVMSLRAKKRDGKKLSKSEQEFYKTHKKDIDIKQKLTKDEKEEQEDIKRMLGLI